MSSLKNSAVLASLIVSLAAHADSLSEFKERFTQKFPVAADAKFAPAFPGFWSVVKGNEVLFVRDDMSVMITGDVIDLHSNRSLSADLREANRTKIKVSELNLKDAIKMGKGSRKLYVFSDPDCPYCRQLQGELGKLKDVELYIFPYPLVGLHPQAKQVAESIWCQAKQADAWNNYLLKNAAPPVKECDTPIARNLAFGEKHQIFGTPALIFPDGTLIPGLLPADRIETLLARGGKP